MEQPAAEQEKHLDREEETLKRRTLKHNVASSGIFSVMSAISDNFVNPLAIYLGASPNLIGYLKSIPQLIAPFFQIMSASITDKLKNRKKIVLASILLQALIFIPAIMVALYFRNPWLVLLVFGFHALFGSFLTPPFSSWLGDIVEPEIRGKYFGFSNKVSGFVSVVSLITAGIILQFFTDRGAVFVGFAVIFLIAGLARLASAYFVGKMHEPKYVVEKEHYFSFGAFLKNGLTKTDFGRYTLFISAVLLAANLAGPFFAIYMLRDLHFTFLQLTMVTLVSGTITFLVMTYWGKYADIFGNRTILAVTGFLIPVTALLWMFSDNFYYILFIQVVGGFAWAGFNLSAGNYFFDTVRPEKRARAAAYFNIINGIGIFVGVTIGGFLLTFLGNFTFSAAEPIFNSRFKVLFLVSTIARLLVMLYFIPKIKEVRVKVEAASQRQLFFKLVAIEPARETVMGIADGLSMGVSSARMITRGVRRFTARPYTNLVRVTGIDQMLREINSQITGRIAIDVDELVERTREIDAHEKIKISKLPGSGEKKTLLSKLRYPLPPLKFKEIDTVIRELTRIQQLRERTQKLRERAKKFKIGMHRKPKGAERKTASETSDEKKAKEIKGK